MTTATIPPRTATATTNSLLEPYVLSGSLTLNNTIVMAPMTRSMAADNLSPTEEMAAYYERRAGAGLIVTEATIVRPDGQGYPNTPGIYNEDQVAGWRRVTQAVHSRGGRIFLQLWHVGRVSHPVFLDGSLPIAPSPVPLSGAVPRRGELRYGTPRGLAIDEIPPLVDAFARGAANALDAGFDGVEIHGANGYLIDQFLHHHTNRRKDGYGGSPERMARFALEVVDAVVQAVGRDRTGIRLSPGAYMNMEPQPADAEVFRVLLGELNKRRLAYVHVGIFDDSMTFDYLGGSASSFIRQHYSGTLIGNGGYTPERAERAIAEGGFNLIAIGRPFIANPDLVDKVRRGTPLATYEPSMLATLN